MGAQHKRKMQSAVLLVSPAVIFANASPISDSVVPEDTDFAMDTDLSEARATINDMIADGASDADCRKLTGDTINDIKSSVEILQKEIDAVSSGVECNTEGQTQVKITAEAQTKAHTTLTTAKKELQKTTEAKVDFGSRVYSTLTVGKCDTFFSHGAYVTAKASFKTASKAFELATGAHTQAVTEAKMAVETAKKLRRHPLQEEEGARDSLQCQACFRRSQSQGLGQGPPDHLCARRQDVLQDPSSPHCDSWQDLLGCQGSQVLIAGIKFHQLNRWHLKANYNPLHKPSVSL